MDKDKQRRLILEAQGWSELYRKGVQALRGKSPDGKKGQIAPNPLTNLNAMHEAEKWLRGTDEEYHNDPSHHIRWNTYQDYLIRKFGISASAQDRADTFVKVIGQWQPEPERRGGEDV